MAKSHEVSDIAFSGSKLHIIVDGRAYDIDITRHSQKLASASPEQRAQFLLSPTGYGIHWPGIDEDLAIDGLIGVSHKRPVAKLGP